MLICCAGAIVAACSEKDAEIARLRAELAAAVPEPVAVANARTKAALDAARDLLAILRREGGYRTATQQRIIRGVRAMVEEMGG